jgi:hypothetical protein
MPSGTPLWRVGLLEPCAAAMQLSTYIREVLCLNAGHPDWGFRCFPPSLHVNASALPRLRCSLGNDGKPQRAAVQIKFYRMSFQGPNSLSFGKRTTIDLSVWQINRDLYHLEREDGDSAVILRPHDLHPPSRYSCCADDTCSEILNFSSSFYHATSCFLLLRRWWKVMVPLR